VYSIRFRGGEQASVYIGNRSNRGDIDLVVRDNHDRIVGRDFRPNQDAHASWFVPTTAVYTIHVRYYRGAGPLRFTLTTN
jgi:hypothetical protein